MMEKRSSEENKLVNFQLDVVMPLRALTQDDLIGEGTQVGRQLLPQWRHIGNAITLCLM